MITINGRELHIPEEERLIGIRDDTGAEIRAFVIPRYHCGVDLADKTCILWYAAGNTGNSGVIDTAIEPDRIIVTWHIDAAATAKRGTLLVHLQFMSDDYNLQTEEGDFYVEAVHDIAEQQTAQYPNEFARLENSVANLQAEIETKQDILTFDAAPTDGSSNPVTSDGVYDALEAKDDVFIITIGDTSSEATVNLPAAVEAGKAVFCRGAYSSPADGLFRLVWVQNAYRVKAYIFSGVGFRNNTPGIYSYNCSINNSGTVVWGDSTTPTPLAKLNSPVFTGTPAAPTAADGTDTTQIATTEFVQAAFTSGRKKLVLESSTPNSTKKFEITVDDSGTITATEI